MIRKGIRLRLDANASERRFDTEDHEDDRGALQARLLASTAGRINAKLDTELKKFAERALEDPFPYPVLDARYEKVRDQAVLVVLGVASSGGRQVLGVDLAEDRATRAGAGCGE